MITEMAIIPITHIYSNHLFAYTQETVSCLGSDGSIISLNMLNLAQAVHR